MNNFQIKRFKRIRRRTDYIILVPSTLFIEDFYIDPVVLDSGKLFTWGIWERYFIEDLYKISLPCHYFVEQVAEDYTVIKGLPDFQPSYFIEDLVQTGIVTTKYLNSIIIMVGENFNRYPLERRLCTQLSYKVLDPLLRDYNLKPDRIKFIDECFESNWEESLSYSNLKYRLETSKYFDMELLKTFVNKYKNY